MLEYKINPELLHIIQKERMFELFKHAGLYCVIQRNNHFGNYCGYVAVDTNHPCYNLSYTGETSEVFEAKMKSFISKIPHVEEKNSDAFARTSQPTEYFTYGGIKIQDVSVHGGLTYAAGELLGINDNILGKLWWFGFDTAHYQDKHVFINSMIPLFNEGTYKDFEYVKTEVKQLAEQLQQIHTDYVNRDKNI